MRYRGQPEAATPQSAPSEEKLDENTTMVRAFTAQRAEIMSNLVNQAYVDEELNSFEQLET
jgi:hypothetical protein